MNLSDLPADVAAAVERGDKGPWHWVVDGERCGQVIPGLYQSETICARPAGHFEPHTVNDGIDFGETLPPPAVFARLDQPCPHTNATPPVYNGGNYGDHGTQRCKDCGATRDDWSDWPERRLVFTIVKPCPTCGGRGKMPWADGKGEGPCGTCGSWARHGSGSVSVARATLRITERDDGRYDIILDEVRP
jgi:hypothetical protein